MATFRTGPDGRTVISDDNLVTVQTGDIDRGGFTARERAAGVNRVGANPGTSRTVNRFDDDPRSGGFGPPVAGLDTGTGYMTRQEFENVAGMTDTNPYGRDGFLTRIFGIDPSKIDYTNHLGRRGIENVKRMAYDKFLNPFAKVDVFGRPTMFADDVAGTTRSGIKPGDLTIYGPAIESRPEPLTGIGALFNDTMIGRLANPPRTRVTGYDTNILLPDLMAGPAVGGGTEPPGVPYFTSSTAPTRDAASVPESTFRPLFTTDPEERNLIEEDFEVDRRATAEDSPVSRGTVPESTYRPIFTDDVTVADVIAAAPTVTTSPVVSENRIVQTREGRIPDYNPNPAPSAPVARESILGPATDRLRQNIDELEDTRRRMEFFQDVYDELYPAPESVSAVSPLPQPSVEGPIDLVSMLPPPPVMTPTPKPSRGPTPGDLAFARILEQRLAQQKALR